MGERPEHAVHRIVLALAAAAPTSPSSFAGRVVCSALVALAAGARAVAAQAPSSSAAEVARSLEAVRIEGSAPRIDGRLDDVVWTRAAPATGFVQREPTEGEPAPEATEVRFAYDDAALYIGARMYSDDPAAIRSQVTRRDNDGGSEHLVISLDTHHDRRTAYSFAVTPAGVRIDYYQPSDFEDRRDYGFDPVWEVRTSIDSLGWTAELRIPLTQLRFSRADEQVWGVNVVRNVPARNEASYWVLVRRDDTGWASRMGTLTGVRGIRASRRIEALPYVAADATLSNSVDPRDPFVSEREETVRFGGDLKMGIGPNLTLDATFNPDFGQVEADPAEVNLTAYETFFQEKRPFFTEGAQLFEARGLFYSRRIGAPPPRQPDADYAERVENTTILGATKLTGRLPSGLSLGVLGAVTGREEVATLDAATGEFGSAVVAPTTGYAVASVQQEFGPDASTLSALVTAVQRDVAAGSPLAELVARSAYSGIVDGRIRWAGGKYDASAYFGFTHVRGDAAAILRLQRSSSRYWQRPDARHVVLDPRRRSLTGTMLGINHSKMAGEHWLWDVDFFQESPGLEANDVGAFGSVDDRGLIGRLRYRETRPGRVLRAYDVGMLQYNEWNFGGDRTTLLLGPFANLTLPNFWRVFLDGEWSARGVSDALTRGGPLMGTGRAWSVSGELQNSRGARNRWGFEWGVSGDELGGNGFRLEGDFTLRPGPRWSLSLDPRWIRRDDARQYIDTRDGGRPETFGRRYLFAHVERHEVASRIRLNYTFTPNLTLETYAEPFASSGTFYGFGELSAPRSRELREYGTGGTSLVVNDDGSRTVTADGETLEIPPQDFNVRSFRSNVVLRWEWRPGSTAYLVWQQDRAADRAPGTVQPGDLWDAIRAGGDNYLALKVSYWLPVR